MHVASSRAAHRSSVASLLHVEALEPRRLLSAGAFDTSFSGDGQLNTNFGQNLAEGNAVAVQADGKIVAAGVASLFPDGDLVFAIARFNTNGSLDQTFGNKGVVFADPLRLLGFAASDILGVSAVSIGPGGTIFVGGTERRVDGDNIVDTWAMLKLQANGSLDKTWGVGGADSATFNEAVDCRLNALVARPDGSIIVAGSLGDQGVVGEIGPKGLFTPGFGTGGFQLIDFPSLSPVSMYSLAVQSDGKIVAAGDAGAGIGVVRLKTTGAFDAPFGIMGETTTVPDPGAPGMRLTARAVGIEPNGDIIVGGARSTDQVEWLLARYLPNGTPDIPGGYTFVHFPGVNASINALAVQPDGNILVAGADGDMAIVGRLKGNLNFDGSFAGSGEQVFQYAGQATSAINAIAFGSNGKIAVVGTASDKNFAFVLAVAQLQSGITTGNITGTIYNDANANGKRDASEKGIAGRTVYIDKNKNGKLDAGEPKTTTSSTGTYTFAKLALGTYRFRQVIPSGWRATSPAAGYYDVTVSAGITSGGKDFADTTKAQISGIVFKDANSNHIQDKGEAALAGWVIYLDANNNGKLDTGEQKFTTGTDGRFSFIVAAGTYHLREVLKSGFKRTTPTSGVYKVTLGSGQVISGQNFGNR